MGLFNIFKSKKTLPNIDFGQLVVDMHSHLIPGIDDGAQNMDETIALLAKFESMGYKKIITTPHVYSDCYKNTPEIILGGLKQVKQTAKDLGLSIEIEAAAEYYCDEYFLKLINQKELLTINNKYVLMEFSFHTEMENWKEFVFGVQAAGYTPIIAHFERYVYWHGSTKVAEEMIALGAKLQLNINSLTGHYGPHIKKQSELLIDKELFSFLATDCHRIQHLLLMENSAGLPYLHKVLNSGKLLNQDLA
ncbi:MAG: histidinol phosphatase [Crocinitomicaceae bacterium]|nr:histidinol phosphatase [Crocinitomicaceae bacterium]